MTSIYNPLWNNCCGSYIHELVSSLPCLASSGYLIVAGYLPLVVACQPLVANCQWSLAGNAGSLLGFEVHEGQAPTPHATGIKGEYVFHTGFPIEISPMAK